MSKMKIAALALVGVIVIAVGVSLGVGSAMDRRDAERAEAVAAALRAAEEQEAADKKAAAEQEAAAERARAVTCAAKVDIHTGFIEDYVSRKDDSGVRFMAGNLADKLEQGGCAPEAAVFRDHYLRVADEIYNAE